MLNALSFDIEGFVESNVQSFPIPASMIGRKEEAYEVEHNTESILTLLNDCGCKATFFFLASVAENVPHLIRTVGDQGHEIGVHGPDHVRVFDVPQRAFRDRLVATKSLLEDLSGRPVVGFRAPDFSITDASTWAFDVLIESGFGYDSSVFPFGHHDVYGIKDVNPAIHRLPNGLVEFPLSTYRAFGTQIPFGGGGYFRFYPLALTDVFVRRVNAMGQPSNVYMHPYEVGPILPEIPAMSPVRRLRHRFNCGRGYGRLRRLVTRHRFGPIAEVLTKAGWLGSLGSPGSVAVQG